MVVLAMGGYNSAGSLGGSLVSFEGIDRIVAAFGGGGYAFCALVVVALAAIGTASASPFFRWLTANAEGKRRHERFIRTMDQRIASRVQKAGQKIVSGPPKGGRRSAGRDAKAGKRTRKT